MVNKENNKIDIKKNNIIFSQTDPYELYSFAIYLYLFTSFNLYLLKQPFIQFLFYFTTSNIFLNYAFNYNIITFFRHNYWRYNLNNIAIPQLISCVSNIYFINNYNYYIIIPLNFVLFLTLTKMYKNEIKSSRNLRFILMIVFFFCHFSQE